MIIIDYALICTFMLFSLAMVIKVAVIFSGFTALITTILYVASAMAGVYFIVKKARYRRIYQRRSFSDMYMTEASSTICLVISNLFLSDISASYKIYIGNVGYYILSLLFIVCPWLYSIICWIAASLNEEEFIYLEFIKQIISSVIFVLVVTFT